jgi:UTP--glucose-1-phosphate uridylyltransferase
MLPITGGSPKELLPFAGRPLIHHAVEEAAGAGFESAVIVISPAKAAIREYFQSVRPPLPLSFVIQPVPAGPGDAVLVASDGSTPVAVLLPDDVIFGTDHWRLLTQVHRQTGASVICVRKIPLEEASRFGIAVCTPSGGILRVHELVEKPAPGSVASDLAILGRYLVTPAVLVALAHVRRSEGDLYLTEGLAAVIGQIPGVVAVEFTGDVFDIGTPEEYRRSLNRYALRRGEEGSTTG